MRRSGVRFLGLRRTDGGDCPLPGEYKGGRRRCEVDLPAQLKMAGGAGEATCGAYHVRSFVVVFALQTTKAGWRIADIQYKDGRSLWKILKG